MGIKRSVYTKTQEHPVSRVICSRVAKECAVSPWGLGDSRPFYVKASVQPSTHDRFKYNCLRPGATIRLMESIPPGTARVVGTAVLEVWVHASLLRGKATCRVILEKTIQEIEAGFF